MPIHECTLPNGKKGFQWGQHGKCYADRGKAEAQAAAAYAHGYKGSASEQLTKSEHSASHTLMKR